MTPDDLWPEDLGIDFGAVEPPAAILDQQAELLRARTHGVVRGVVVREDLPERPNEVAGFTLGTSPDATALHFYVEGQDGFRYRLFTVAHDSELPYPARLTFAADTTTTSDPTTSTARSATCSAPTPSGPC